MKDNIADITLQQVLTRPDDFDVIATTNLNGDYLSDALAAQVGGIGIAPGGNINYVTGHGIFEATHGTAPKYAGQDKVNPSSVLLSGVMMFEHLGWTEAAADIERALEATIADKIVTYDFARLMEGATEVKTSRLRPSHRRTPVDRHPYRRRPMRRMTPHVTPVRSLLGEQFAGRGGRVTRGSRGAAGGRRGGGPGCRARSWRAGARGGAGPARRS